MTKLSVIIRCKGSSGDFERCIKSVCSYMGKDLEIIVLTNNLIDELQDTDKRIKFIDSGCENLNGTILNTVTGKYVTLLNPCDYFDKDGLSKIMSIIRTLENDIIMLSYNVETQDGELKRIKCLFNDTKEFNVIENETLIKKLIIPNNLNIFQSVLLNTNFIKYNNIKLDTILGNFESELFLFDSAKSIIFKDIRLFVFKPGNKENYSEFNFNSFDVFKVYCEVQSKYLEKWNAKDDIVSDVYAYKYKVLSQMFYEAFKSSNENTKKLKEVIKSDWVKEIVHNVDDKKLDSEHKKSLTAFKLGKVKMLWIMYKFKK